MSSTTKKYTLSSSKSSNFLRLHGWDLLLGAIAAFYVFTVPYTKVEESFNVQAMHDILYHLHHLEKYDHFDFPGVVPRTFIGAFLVSVSASPIVVLLHVAQLPRVYGLIAVRLVLGCIILSTLWVFRIQVRRKFGYQVEAFFVILTACQFHLLFYITRPLPNTLAFGLVSLSYAFWLKGNSLAALRCLVLATVVFRCDTVLLLAPIGFCLLLTKSVSLWKAFKCCASTAIIGAGLSILVDSIMWQRIVWPEMEVLWFNSILNRSSEWGTNPFHWYFTSALPRSLLVAYPLSLLGMLFDRRIVPFVLPIFSFIFIYSKLPHKELRFILGSIPIFNLSAAIAASRIYNNRNKSGWKLLYLTFLGSLTVSLGCSLMSFMASYQNYPAAHALKALHQVGHGENKTHMWVHIDSFSAINGISRFCENGLPWMYSKEEGIAVEKFQHRSFTYLVNENPSINGFECLFAVDGFSRVSVQVGFPPIFLLKEPKVYVHGNMKSQHVASLEWPGCPRLS